MNMVDDVPLDPMHLVHLGVTKKMSAQWMERKKCSAQKLSLQAIAVLNEKMIACAKYYPREFQRKLRRMDH